MREIQDIMDVIPYCLLFVLPVFIALSPINPCVATHDFPVHRLAHFELGNTLYGSKIAALSMEARTKTASKVLRKVVIAKLEELSVATYNDLVANNLGGLVLLVPPKDSIPKLSKTAQEAMLFVEEHLANGEVEAPIYFAEETPELENLLTALEGDSSSTEANSSAARAILDGIVSNGFQLVSAASNPKVLADQEIMSMQGTLTGAGEEDNLPTIAIVAHYDAAGVAPSLSYGADSNGSGITILMELARIWHQLYASTKSRPKFNMVFFLSGGGKINYIGTKKWLDDHKDDSGSEIVSNIKLAVCLDSLGSTSNNLNLFVSKPPKEGTLAYQFFGALKSVATHLYPEMKINLVHKKINLASEFLAWEHEQFSIHKISALTLTHFENANTLRRTSILDRHVDERNILRNTRLIGEALACVLYGLKQNYCIGSILTDDHEPSAEMVKMWTEELASSPRGTSLLVGKSKSLNQIPILKSLKDGLRMHSDDFMQHFVKREKRDPEFTFYDVQETTMSSYKVKPAVFDLVVTLGITGYLGVIYLVISKWASLYSLLAAFVVVPGKGSPKSEVNGNSKMKSH